MSQETGTRVTINIGGDKIPATLNNTTTAREFTKTLPFTVTADPGAFDFCATADPLPVKDSETQAGWRNGDIGYNRGWFALFRSGEEQSRSHTSEMIIGHIDDRYLDTLRDIHESVEITVATAE